MDKDWWRHVWRRTRGTDPELGVGYKKAVGGTRVDCVGSMSPQEEKGER